MILVFKKCYEWKIGPLLIEVTRYYLSVIFYIKIRIIKHTFNFTSNILHHVYERCFPIILNSILVQNFTDIKSNNFIYIMAWKEHTRNNTDRKSHSQYMFLYSLTGIGHLLSQRVERSIMPKIFCHMRFTSASSNTQTDKITRTKRRSYSIDRGWRGSWEVQTNISMRTPNK